MISTDMFTNFGRRQAGLKKQPHVVIADTPNPIRQLDEDSIRWRAAAMMDTIVWGLTSPSEVIEQHNQGIAARTIRPAGMIRASHSA